MYFFLFLYFCAIGAHKLGTGFDAVFLRVTFVIYVGMWALNLISSKSRLVVNNYSLWVFLFYGYCFLSMWWAKSIEACYDSVGTVIQIIVISITFIQIISSNEDIEKILKLVLYSQVYSAIVLLIKTPSEMFGEERLSFVTGLHANTLGYRFAVSIFLCVYFIMKNKRFKVFYIALAVGFAALILLTGSRKAFVMSIVFLVFFVILYKSKDMTINSIYKKFFLFIVVIFLAILFWSIAMNNEMFYNLIGKRLKDMFDTFMGSGSDGSMHARDELRNLGWELFKQHPIVGYGFSNFVTYTREVGYFMHTYSHDNFVELLSTLGLIGTSLFYIPLTDICFNIYFASKKAKNKNLGILIFVFMFLQIIFSSYSMFYHDEFYFIFASCGYMYYYINYKSKKEEDSNILVLNNKETK